MSFDVEEILRSWTKSADGVVNHGEDLETIRRSHEEGLKAAQSGLREFDMLDGLVTLIANLEKYAKAGVIEHQLKNLSTETRKLIFERGLPATIEAYKAELVKRSAKIIDAYKESLSV